MEDSNLIIYKYMSYDVAEAVVTGKHLKFENPQKFNDPFDCVIDRIYFSFDKNKIDESVKRDIELLTEKFGKDVIEKIPTSDLEDFYRKHAKEKIDKSAVCCFSRSNNNPLLWSHYSDKHKGICLEFSFNKNGSPFPSLSSDKISHGFISYPLSNDYVNYFESKKEGIKQLFLTKSKHWEYEEEFRFFLFTEPALYRFEDSFLVGVIFGLRVTEESQNTFKRLCIRSGYSNLKYSFAKQNKLELEICVDNDKQRP